MKGSVRSVGSGLADFRSVVRPLSFVQGGAGAPAEARSLSKTPRCAVLINAHAKRVNLRVIQALNRWMSSEDVFVSQSLEEAESMADTVLSRGYELVLLGGGDGTVAAAFEMFDRNARGRRLPDFGVLRLGTGNAVAGLVGAGTIRQDVDRALKGLGQRAMLRTVQIETPSGPRLAPFASLGYDALVLNDYLEVSKAHGSWSKSLAGYVWAAATRSIPKHLRSVPTEVSVTTRGRASLLDYATGEEIPFEQNPDRPIFEGTAQAVLVGTTPYYGYGLKVLPYAQQRLDRFQVRVSTASVGYILSRLPWLWRGTLKTRRFVDFLVEQVSIETKDVLPAQVAGDAHGYTKELKVKLSDRRFFLRHLHPERN